MFKIRILLVLFFINHLATAQIAATGQYFDGIDDYVTLPALPFFTSMGTNPFTIEAWIRCDAGNLNDEYTIISTRNEQTFLQGFKLCIESGYLSFTAPMTFSQALGGGRLDDGLCHHIAVVKETSVSGYKAYIDGVLYALTNTSVNLSSPILPYIGKTEEQFPQWNSCFTGIIKELRVWSTGRTQSQIQANVNVVVPYNSANLVHYWRFNEGIGTTVHDYSVTVGGGTGSSLSYTWLNACSGCLLASSHIDISTTANVCPPATVTLTASTGPGYTYQWRRTPNNYIIPGATGSTYVATLNDWYSVVITNSCGSVSSNYQLASISILPTAIITPSGSVNACNSITLYANSASGFTYQWKKNGIVIAGATGYMLPVTASGSYSVVVTNVCGTAVSNPVSVTITTVVPSTPGSITTTGGSTKVCPGETRTYSISSIANVTSYTWTAPQGGVIQSGQGTTSVVISFNSGFTVTDTLRVKANNNCGSSNIRKLAIVRNNPAKPSLISGANYGLCNGSAIPYSVTNVSGITYNWFFSVPNTSVVSGQGSNAITANYVAGFLTGVLNVTAANGCGVSAARTLSVYAKPATPASITGPAQVCVNQQNVPYTITPLYGATTYTWTSPTGATVSDGIVTANTITSNATSVLVDFAATSGNVRARGNNSCAAGSYRSLAVTFNCREAEGVSEEEPISIFPNPFDDELVVDGAGFTEARIVDSQGRLVYHSVLDESTQTLKPGLPDGVYMITLISNSGIKTYRVMRMGNSGKN